MTEPALMKILRDLHVVEQAADILVAVLAELQLVVDPDRQTATNKIH